MTGPRRVALVLGTTAGGTGAHVRMLAQALARHGIAVDILGPSAANAGFGFDTLGAAVGDSSASGGFHAVEFGDRPRAGDVSAVLRLRRLLSRPGSSGPGSSGWGGRSGAGGTGSGPGGGSGARGSRSSARADIAHAHGMRAGALAVIALAGRRGPRVVVTVHNAPPTGGAAVRYVYLALERIVARGADLVLCVSGDLEERMRRAGARRVGRAVVPASPLTDAGTGDTGAGDPAADGVTGRPVVLAVGRLAAQKGFDVLLRAAVSWRDMDPRPRVVIAGAGPLGPELRRLAGELGIDAEFPGRREDVAALLATASVFVLPSLWEGQPLILQEALRAATPVVASRTGGVPDLTGEDAAVLVPPGQPGPLAAAVREVLADPARADGLRAAARDRAASLPTEEEAVAAVLASYATVLG